MRPDCRNARTDRPQGRCQPVPIVIVKPSLQRPASAGGCSLRPTCNLFGTDMTYLWQRTGATDWLPLMSAAQFPGFRRPLRWSRSRVARGMLGAVSDCTSGTRHTTDLDWSNGADRSGLEPSDPCSSQLALAGRVFHVRGNHRSRPLVRTAVHQSSFHAHPYTCAHQGRFSPRPGSATASRSLRRCDPWCFCQRCRPDGID